MDPLISTKVLAPPFQVDTPEALMTLVDDLSREPAFGVDTESNSLFAYRERVCLIQFSTPHRDYIVDALRFTELKPLAPLFASQAYEKVFHAAEYDILCLKRDYGFEFAGLFDTMLAARTLGWPQTGLAPVLEKHFDVRLSKKYQRANWGHRPLSSEEIEYARRDTHYLLRLRDLQIRELAERGRLEEARDEFGRLIRIEPDPVTVDHNQFWRVKGARDLSPAQAAVLRELYLFRERQASRADRPPFKIMGDQTLMEIVQLHPKTLRGLNQIHGMTPGQIHRYGPGLLRALQYGLEAPLPRPPHAERVSFRVRQRYNRLLEWRKEKARERGVESDMILPRDALWLLARHAPKTLDELEALQDIGPWRRKAYGEELINLLR